MGGCETQLKVKVYSVKVGLMDGSDPPGKGVFAFLKFVTNRECKTNIECKTNRECKTNIECKCDGPINSPG